MLCTYSVVRGTSNIGRAVLEALQFKISLSSKRRLPDDCFAFVSLRNRPAR